MTKKQNTNVIELTYKKIIDPIFELIIKREKSPYSPGELRDVSRTKYFEWRLNGFPKKSLLEMLLDDNLSPIVKEFVDMYSKNFSPAWSFYGSNHGRVFASTEQKSDNGILGISYIRNWEFGWRERGRDYTFYREVAWPDDCVGIFSENTADFLDDLAAIKFAELMYSQNKDNFLSKLKTDFSKFTKKNLEELAIKSFVNGVVTAYSNDTRYEEIRDEPYTGEKTDAYTMQDSRDYWDYKDGYKMGTYQGYQKVERIKQEAEEREKEWKKFDIIKYFSSNLKKDKNPPKRKPNYTFICNR